jgi:hypothetical protein
MADEVKNNINEGYTEFGDTSRTEFYFPTGPLSRFMAKFFFRKAVPELKKELELKNGDTIVNPDVIKTGDDRLPIGAISRTPLIPEVELNRKKRYKEYEEMDGYPEICASFDIYADDTTQKNNRNEEWTIKSDSQDVIDEIDDLFNNLQISRFLWDVTRNTVKYGDCFVELVLDVNKPEMGLRKIKILNPSYILRVEDEYGYLKEFLQEIPDKTSLEMMGTSMYGSKPSKYIKLDKNQIVHFRLHTSDPAFYPYGKSIAASCHRTFKSLRMMEDAMMIYRLSRAPERRIFYIDTGNLPTQKAELFIERIKDKFKKEKFYNNNLNTVDARYNPMSVDEDFFVATRNGVGTKIDTLPGAENLGEVDDVKYFRDKLLAALKIPKDYIVEFDKSPERKANLAQLDVKFARVIMRVQKSMEVGLENLAKRHLQLKKYPPAVIKQLKIKLPDPSDMFAKRKLDLDEQKIRVVQAVNGLQLLPKRRIYKEYFDMSEREIEEVMEEMDAEQREAAEMQAQQQPPQSGMAGPGYSEAGGQEGAENAPPTEQPPPVAENLLKLSSITGVSDKEKLILERIIQKQSNKVKKL